MTFPKPHQPADIVPLTQSLKVHSERILAQCAATIARESREQAVERLPGPLQKSLPLLLDELIALLPGVMAGEATAAPAVPAASLEPRAEHRLDVVINALAGIREVVVLELRQLKGCVADALLDDACRETRLFFDVKLARYCRAFVAAQAGELALRVRQLKAASERQAQAAEVSHAAAHSRLLLLQGVTLELRNALQAVLLYAESLLDDPRDAAVTEVVERLAVNGFHLQKLLDRLRTCAPLLADEVPAAPAAVDLGGFLRELQQRHAALAKAGQTRLLCTQHSGPANITTDASLLNLIADSLVSNALHAARQGVVQVEVSAEGPERLLLKVADDGDGISVEVARQVFRVMHHVPGSSCRSLKLGLLTSRYAAHALGGELAFESEAGQGTSFTLDIPTNAGADG